MNLVVFDISANGMNSFVKMILYEYHICTPWLSVIRRNKDDCLKRIERYKDTVSGFLDAKYRLKLKVIVSYQF